MKLLLENTSRYIEFHRYRAIDLEVKLNLTEKGKEYMAIGDALFYNKDITLTGTEFLYMRDLAIKNRIQMVESES